MSIDTSTRGSKVPAVPSISNHAGAPKINNEEDDAALVDSFFLPGGLFSDESNKSHQNESKIASSNHDVRIYSVPRTASSRSCVRLPKNPWEAETFNTTTLQQTHSGEGSSTLCFQPIRPSLSSTNGNGGYEKRLRSDNATLNGIKGNTNHSNSNDQYPDFEEEIIAGTTIIDASHVHQKRDMISPHENETQEGNIDIIMTSRIENENSIIRPPPGFQSSQPFIPNTDTATGGTSTEKKYLLPSNDNHLGTVIGEKDWTAADDLYNLPVRAFDFSVPSVSYPLHTFQQKVSQSSKNSKGVEFDASGFRVRPCVPNDKDDNEESNSYLVQYLKNPPLSGTTVHLDRVVDGHPEALVFATAIGSERKSLISNDYIEDDYGDDDAGDVTEVVADVQEGTSEDSIPSNICMSVGAESNSSSLSTCSEVDMNSEVSSDSSGDHHHINDDDFKDEVVEYDTDRAHIFQSVDTVESKLCSAVGANAILDDEQPSSPAPNDTSEGATPRTRFFNEQLHHDYIDRNNACSTTQKLMAFLHSMFENCRLLIDRAILAVQGTSLYTEATIRQRRIIRQMRKLSQDCHEFANWLIDVEEVFAVFLIRLLNAGGKYSRNIAKALTMIFSFLFQLLKFGLIEGVEEFYCVMSCYVVLYLLPGTCVFLMYYISLPHWTPHTVTWLAIFSLCRQVEARALHKSTTHFSMPPFTGKLVPDTSATQATTSHNEITAESPATKTITQQLPSPQQQQVDLSRAQDKQICFLLLKVLKTILPVLFMVEGFSSEFGTIFGANSTNRLITAFVLSILRKSLLSSPIGWVSWALQVLLAVHYSSCIILDVLILLIGLSSIRLIRFLDLQRTHRKRIHERPNKY